MPVTRSSLRRGTKRKRRSTARHKNRARKGKRHFSDNETDEEEEVSINYHWLDEGCLLEDGSLRHSSISVSMDGRSFVINEGDSIMLRSSDSQSFGSPVGSDAFLAKVERMWEEPESRVDESESAVKLRTRWFFRKTDVACLREEFSGPLSRKKLLESMEPRDVVLSDQTDDNNLLSLLGTCRILFQRPELEDIPDEVTGDAMICRYSLNFCKSDEHGRVTLTPYSGKGGFCGTLVEPDEPTELVDAAESKQHVDDDKQPNSAQIHKPLDSNEEGKVRSGPKVQSDSSAMTDSAANSVTGAGTDLDPPSGAAIETPFSDDCSESSKEPEITEGSTTKGNILVGPDHQVDVPPFDRSESSKYRNAIKFWRPNAIDDDELDKFLAAAAAILQPYADEHCPTRRGAHAVPHGKEGTQRSGSSLCPAKPPVLSVENKFPREFKIEAILNLLWRENYNTAKALDVVRENPHEFLTIWTKTEIDIFNTGFRRYGGSLRMIAKRLETKSHGEVVDFHYRFRIPDHFCRFRDKKEEQAERMIECIETRKHHDSLRQPSGAHREDAVNPNGKAKTAVNWSVAGSEDAIDEADDRRANAKDLLLEIRKALGDEVMTEIASAIRRLHKSSTQELKSTLKNKLRDHPHLLDRLLDFLPKRLRS